MSSKSFGWGESAIEIWKVKRLLFWCTFRLSRTARICVCVYIYWWGVAIITADIFTWVTCSFLETLDLLAGNMFSSLSLTLWCCGGFSLLNALQKNAGVKRGDHQKSAEQRPTMHYLLPRAFSKSSFAGSFLALPFSERGRFSHRQLDVHTQMRCFFSPHQDPLARHHSSRILYTMHIRVTEYLNPQMIKFCNIYLLFFWNYKTSSFIL